MDVKVTPIEAKENQVHYHQLPPDDTFAHLETQFKGHIHDLSSLHLEERRILIKSFQDPRVIVREDVPQQNGSSIFIDLKKICSLNREEDQEGTADRGGDRVIAATGDNRWGPTGSYTAVRKNERGGTQATPPMATSSAIAGGSSCSLSHMVDGWPMTIFEYDRSWQGEGPSLKSHCSVSLACCLGMADHHLGLVQVLGLGGGLSWET
ncbi:hypothetical protein Scep_004889 [Stephania cephalantha]|uniref:Uncharacterized protein n=1 Tax=Stephania cephalantha TaxID=152367 RepID=A0AAP0KU68_9MAGN